jgi:hypothetical protein
MPSTNMPYTYMPSTNMPHNMPPNMPHNMPPNMPPNMPSYMFNNSNMPGNYYMPGMGYRR